VNPFLLITPLILLVIDPQSLLLSVAPIILTASLGLLSWLFLNAYKTGKLNAKTWATLERVVLTQDNHESRLKELEKVKAVHDYLEENGALHDFKKKD